MSETTNKAINSGEDSLRQANQKLQTVLNSITDGLAVLDKDWRYTYINEQGAGIIGMRPEQLLGEVVWELFPHAEGTKFYDEYHRSVATGEHVHFEEFYPAPLNLWLECRCFPSAEGLSVYFHDITARKQAEAILRQNEGLFSALVEQAPTGVYVVDAEFRLQRINARAMPSFAQVEPKIGRDFGEVMNILWGPEIGGQLAAIFRHTLKTGEPYMSSRFSEHRQDLGADKSYEWQIQRVSLPDGQHGVVCYFNDITEHIQSEQALQQAKAVAESANRSKDQFLAALSHELRTPLSPVLLIASEAADNHELPETVRLNFDVVRKNIELEARLIDDLLDLTRITAGKMILNKSLVDVHDVLVDALTTIQVDLQEKNLILFVNCKANSSRVNGDATRLQQVFWNVLKNAVKFTPKEGQITVETSVGPNNHIVIKISDSGIGMSASELTRVFTAFSQGDHAGDGRAHCFGGLGMGLAICQNLIELHSGKIFAASAGLNLGSIFTIELPLTFEAPLSSMDQTGSKRWSEHSDESDNTDAVTISILLVEDHENTRNVLEQLLTRRKYRVVTADSISSALTHANSDKFDLIISDIGLPDGNGNDLMKELNRQYGLSGIALSGYGMEDDISRGKEAGFILHLTKPIRIDALERALTYWKSNSYAS